MQKKLDHVLQFGIMKSLITILALVLSVSSASRLRVSSWNVLCSWFDRPEHPQHKWAARRPVVMQIITDYDSDIIGLQEMSPDQVVEMSKVPGYELYSLIQHHVDIRHRRWHHRQRGGCMYLAGVEKTTWEPF